jgi:hypothetical protein
MLVLTLLEPHLDGVVAYGAGQDTVTGRYIRDTEGDPSGDTLHRLDSRWQGGRKEGGRGFVINTMLWPVLSLLLPVIFF